MFAIAISFLVIGIVWANHHNRFRLISRSDQILLFLNVVTLMCVAFIPFPTPCSPSICVTRTTGLPP